jgi:hypothetical protein
MSGFEIRNGVPAVDGVAILGATRVMERVLPGMEGEEPLLSLRGFHVQSGDWLLSVQWGSGMYCAARDHPEMEESPTAEIAAWRKDEPMVTWPDGDTVQGYVTPQEVLGLILKMQVPGWKPTDDTTQGDAA